MTQGPKYAALPDIDSAPDVYQTPETVKERRQSESSQGSLSGGGSDHENTNGVVRRRAEPGKARTKFRPARVSARNVDFSDRISDQKQSYRVARRSKRSKENGGVLESHPPGAEEDEEDVSDLEETFDEKVSRLRREIEEVKAESERRISEQPGTENGSNVDENALLDMSNLLRSIEVSSATRASENSHLRHTTEPSDQSNAIDALTERNGDYHATEADSAAMDRALLKVGEFETRLALMESALGIHNDQTSLSGNRLQRGKNVLATLSGIEKDLVVLSDVTVPSLEAMDKKIRQANEDAKQLEETRRNTELAHEDQRTRADRLESNPAEPQTLDQADNERKIAALYNTLPNIEAMAPLLPSVLDRLRALRLLHENAAAAGDNLDALEKRQSELNSEITKWREGLGKVKDATENGAQAMSGSKDEIARWVRNLEERINTLD